MSDEELGGDGLDYSCAFITDELFDTKDEAANWAKGIAVFYHFELVIASHKKTGTQVLMRCNRGLPYKNSSKLSDDSPKRRASKTMKCGCEFQIMLVLQKHDDRLFWGICPKAGSKGMHNHPMITYPEGHR
ncbi:hypothetical protein M5689_018218 [Euphorbia peplus]|nr:hypothetical protein M5689_018218 [Euphorbia peplus]